MYKQLNLAVLVMILVVGLGIAYNLCTFGGTKMNSCNKPIENVYKFEKIRIDKPGKIKDFFPEEASFSKPENEDQCFCQLKGAIEDCTCQIDTVDTFNNYKIHPRLQSLLAKNYFRYFQVNLKKECPIWADDGQCALESCQVKECSEDEVPYGLKGQWHNQNRNKQKPRNRCNKHIDIGPCNHDLGHINTTISEESQEGFERWKLYDKSLVDFCSIREDNIDPDLQYVDLHLNPERFTGYAGPSAHRIWKSIYLENCFKRSSASNLMAPFQLDSEDEFCIEKRTFYRVISGLHASINIHLSAKYLLTDTRKLIFIKPKEEVAWGPNLTEFRQHFDGRLTQGQGSSWLKNLYFVYLLELKAISKLSPFLQSFNFYTGDAEDDSDVLKAILDLVGVVQKFPSHFEETILFSRDDAPKLRAEYHKRFTNITRIMDCVGCQKCKLWGKIQIKGLGTALKILFAEPFNHKQVENVTRNEIVALLNSFGRLSESIYELGNFRRIIKEEKLWKAKSKPKVNDFSQFLNKG